MEEENSPVSRCPVATYQAILIYIIFSLIVQDTTPRRMDFSAVLSPSDFQLLSALVGTCLRNDIFYYPRMLDRYHDISSVTCIWVGVEEIKRLGLALYKVSRLCSNGNCQESNTRGDNRLLRLSDLRFPLPASRRLWDAESVVNCLGYFSWRGIEALDWIAVTSGTGSQLVGGYWTVAVKCGGCDALTKGHRDSYQ